jgi:hypothetical protein
MKHLGERAFTALELLIVLVIIGFFVAMLAPKLEDMFDDATIKISDTNKKRTTRFERMWQVERGNGMNKYSAKVGNNFTNIIAYYTGGGHGSSLTQWLFPSVAEENQPQDGAEELAFSFMNRLKVYRHLLNDEEVAELHDMGLTHIFTLKSEEDPWGGGFSPSAKLERQEVRSGMRVLMIGAGRWASGGWWNCEADENWTVGGAWGSRVESYVEPDRSGSTDIPPYEDGIAYPNLMYRMLVAVGEDCDLVKDGVVINEGRSPDAMAQEEHYTFANYVVVLPRLRSTVEDLCSSDAQNRSSCPKRIVAVRDVDGDVEEKEWLVADPLLHSAQDPEDYMVLSPEGFKMLDLIEELWIVDDGATQYDIASFSY